MQRQVLQQGQYQQEQRRQDDRGVVSRAWHEHRPSQLTANVSGPSLRPTSRDAFPDGNGSTGTAGGGSGGADAGAGRGAQGVSGAELLRQFQELDGLQAWLEARKKRCSRLRYMYRGAGAARQRRLLRARQCV